MKTIFRSVNLAVLTAVVLALGAVATFAQDPTPAPTNSNCSDSAGQNAARDNITQLFQKKDLPSLRLRIDAGKGFLEKYGSCGSSVQDMIDYLTPNIPKWEADYKKRSDIDVENALVARFDNALKAKNWDEVYASGKEILAKYPGKYMPAEIVLGSIGYDEAFHERNKYNDDTLKYAKMSIADLEAGKPFLLGTATRYGLSLKDVYNFEYADKDDARGWLNYYIGYIIQVGQKNKKDAQPYLFKATQITSAASKSPANKDPHPYELIGYFYLDQLAAIAKEVGAIVDSQKPDDTKEVAEKKVADYNAKIALANGTAARAIDAFAKAYTLGAAKDYKDAMYKNLQAAYKARFGNTDTLNPASIAEAAKKPLEDPMTPVTPIEDAKPATVTTTTVTAPAPTGTPAKPPVATPVTNPPKPNGTTPAKPAGTAPAKPTTKRQASVKKPVAKKKA
jgi:hypothetical protein